MSMRRRGVGLPGVAAVAGVAHHAGTKRAQAQAQEQQQNQKIADLHAAGVLTDEEFAAAKAKVLAGG